MNSRLLQSWVNFLSLLPGTIVTVLVINVAFLRFYDPTDLIDIWPLHTSRGWSTLLTLAAILAALVNFGVEWYRRNREGDRRAEEIQRRAEEAERRSRDEARRVAQERAEAERRSRDEAFRVEEAERAASRARVQARCHAAQIRYQLEPNAAHRQQLAATLAF